MYLEWRPRSKGHGLGGINNLTPGHKVNKSYFTKTLIWFMRMHTAWENMRIFNKYSN